MTPYVRLWKAQADKAQRLTPLGFLKAFVSCGNQKKGGGVMGKKTTTIRNGLLTTAAAFLLGAMARRGLELCSFLGQRIYREKNGRMLCMS